MEKSNKSNQLFKSIAKDPSKKEKEKKESLLDYKTPPPPTKK